MTSDCDDVEIPEPGQGEDEAAALCAGVAAIPFVEAAIARRKGWKLTAARKGKAPPQTICLNSVEITLLANSTAGLKISEVTIGTDIFATNIAVGGSETISEACDPEDCEVKTASVKIVDAAGALVATLGGFPVCRCKA